MDYDTIWFILVGVLLTGYAMLDGFDLGVGGLHLFSKTDEQRRLFLNAIGPVWDGNEVWLVTGGGALFAAFPVVYATAFSGFYLAFWALLGALIFRAVAIEFRSKEKWGWWRKTWDIAFSLGSISSAFLIGVAMGNIIWGIPLDQNHEFTGDFFMLLHPYALFTGVTTVALFMMHGCIYLVMKTEGETQAMVRRWVKPCMAFFLVCYVVFNVLTVFYCPHVVEVIKARPWTLLILLANILIVLNIPRELHHGRDFRGFLSSCVAMALLMVLFACAMYPNMIISSTAPDYYNLAVETLANNPFNLTIINGASTEKTHGIMLLIAVIGMPIVIAYTICVYWIFRGKVEITEESY
jgi:cytochrome d ubiquinol oxidase subunit II